MKISDLVEKLEYVRRKYGDLDISYGYEGLAPYLHDDGIYVTNDIGYNRLRVVIGELDSSWNEDILEQLKNNRWIDGNIAEA